MEISRLHPELRKSYAKIPSIPLHRPLVRSLLNAVMRLIPNKPKSVPGVAVEDRDIGNCAVRIYRPHANVAGAGLLWIHGGGYIMGNTGLNDRDCTEIARDLGLVVVSVDYRLAPRNPFPAAHEDCLDAWRFLCDSAEELGIDSSRLAILGQSAGGGLAAGLVQRLADEGARLPAAQVLMYPMLDDRTAADTSLDAVKHRFFDNQSNRGGWKCFLGQEPGLESVPAYAVPGRRKDLSGLPPTWVCVGELDLLYPEDTAYAECLKQAGVSCELHIAEGAPHAYDAVAPESSVTRATLDSYWAFLRRHLSL